MAPPSPSSLTFTVRRHDPILISPAKPTPHEFKKLSDIDDQEGLRFQAPVIQFYRRHPSTQGRDPAKIIREALAQTLVFYYPFAGRLREWPGRKLVVECTGEGVVFVEAEADVSLQEFGNYLQPPFPCLEELLFDVPGSGGVLYCPLLVIQVTRLKCGGFIFALRLNHTMSDAGGLVQFMTALGEMSRGARAPSILPTWQRELLSARNPPRVTCTHREYDEVADTDSKGTIIPRDDMVHRSFFFGSAEISAIRRVVASDQLYRKCSTFDLLTACLWWCRTRALQLDPAEIVRLICIVNARPKFDTPLPVGFYGNTFAIPMALTSTKKLCESPLAYALELVKNCKAEVTAEYMKSLADLMVIRGRPHFAVVRTYVVSDVTRAGFREVDFGWGKAVYGGPAKGGMGAIPELLSVYVPFRNQAGEDGILVPISLQAAAMERFVKELDGMLKHQPINSTLIKSAL